MSEIEQSIARGGNRKYPRPVYFTEEENQLLKVAALVNEKAVGTYIHDCTMQEIETRKDEYEAICKMINTKREQGSEKKRKEV